jgi:hypothetical protein
MKVSELQEILIEKILNTTKDDLKKDQTIAELLGIEDIDFDSNDNLLLSMDDGSEFELKIKKN